MEVYYSTKNVAYDSHSNIYGSYSVTNEKVNDRYFYQSDFENGKYGIWWCGIEWFVSYLSSKGICRGLARSSSTKFCLEEIGWNWEYVDSGSFQNAKEGLGIRCICSNTDSRGNFTNIDQSELNYRIRCISSLLCNNSRSRLVAAGNHDK